MKATLPALLVLGALCLPLHATTRTSASFSIAAETTNSGGCRATSANYTNDGSTGLVAGISTAAAGTAKAGYIGQLFEVTGLVIGAASSDVNETDTLQLSARQLLDDISFLALDAGAVDWSPVSGPITDISSSGLATAAAVYRDSSASVQGSFAGFTGLISLNVLDTIPDNFGYYATDSLPDNWQVQYFGINNPKAGPNVDADGTGQTNLFKYVAGLDPIDPTSRFSVNIQAVSGQTGQMQIVFSPVVSGSTYTVVSKNNLGDASWVPLANSTQSDSGQQRTVTDLSFSGAKKFYRVSVSKP
jgi:hypothetical protein